MVKNCFVGLDTKIHEPVNMYGCTVGCNCVVGPFVEIQEGAKIGDRTRVQSHSFICSLVDIGADCFIGHGVMFINDVHPPSGKWEKTIISDRVSIGSNATIFPVNIGADAEIGAGAVVLKDVPANAVVAGNPARLIRMKEAKT